MEQEQELIEEGGVLVLTLVFFTFRIVIKYLKKDVVFLYSVHKNTLFLVKSL